MILGRFLALHTTPSGTGRARTAPVDTGRNADGVGSVPPRHRAPRTRPSKRRPEPRPTERTIGTDPRRSLSAVALLAVGCVAAATGAHARPAADPYEFSDHTAAFLPLGAPEAPTARDLGKELVSSPHGTRRTIVCRGNGTTVPRHDCSQEDGLGWTPLHRTDTPVGAVWIYTP